MVSLKANNIINNPEKNAYIILQEKLDEAETKIKVDAAQNYGIETGMLLLAGFECILICIYFVAKKMGVI